MGKRSSLAIAQIANGQTVSSAVNCDGLDVVALQLPAAFTGVAITFQGSADNVLYQQIYDDAGAAVSLTVAQGRYVVINTLTKQLRGMRFLKIVSGSAEGAARVIQVVLADD
jgi:hypothetical protein